MSAEIEKKWGEEILPLINELKSSSTVTLNTTLFKINALLKSKDLGLDSKQLDLILFSVLSTYSRYPTDTKFHNSVLQVFSNFLALDAERYTKNIAAFITKISTHPLAVADLLVLVKWNMFILSETKEPSLFKSVIKVIMTSSANLYASLSEAVQSEEGFKVKQHRQKSINVAESAIFTTFSNVFKSADISVIISAICDSKLPISGVISHIGLISKAAYNFKSIKKNSHIYDSFVSKESEISNFFAKDCLATKSFPTDSSLKIFGFYISKFLTEESFQKVILSGLEKAAGRNSELTIAKFSPCIFQNVSAERINVISIVSKDKFLSKLITSLKATKEPVKVGATNCLTSLLQKYNGANDDVDIVKIIDETLKVMKSTPATAFEQRILLARILDASPFNSASVTQKIITDLLPIAQKDTHELSLAKLLNILFDRLVYSYTRGQSLDQESKLIDAIKAGLGDKKGNVKSVWATSLANAFIDIPLENGASEKVLALFKSGTIELLFNLFKECVNSPLPSITNKVIGGGYAALSILFFLKEAFADATLKEQIASYELIAISLAETESKMSCFTNKKVFLKLNTNESQKWFVYALYSIALDITDVNVLFGHAWIYAALSRNFSPEARILSHKLLKVLMKKNQEAVSKSIVSAINELIRDSDYDSELNFDFKYLSPFIASLLESTADDALSKHNVEHNLIDLLVACHHNIFSGFSNGWVGVCQRAGLDPGSVVSANSEKLIQTLNTILIQKGNDDNGLRTAACNAVGTISFISPVNIVNKFVETINSDFSIIPAIEVDDVKLAIWKGVEGELVVDILSKDNKSSQISKGKDADTLKWEQSVRKELEAKKKTVKKLTKEEQTKVNEQLALESEIRANIDGSYLKLRRSLEIIIALSKEALKVNNGKNIWFPVAISHILNLLNSKNALAISSELATECFLVMGEAVQTSSLTATSSMSFIGSSTLRLHDVDSVPAQYCGKDLNDLLSSQLFSLKLASDKSQFNELILMYVLPLLVKIIENGKNYVLRNTKKIVKVNSEFSEESPEEEQLTLALEIIASNGELFEDSTIPRTAILKNLLELLALPSKAKIAKECFITLCQNAALNMSEADLQMLLEHLIDSNNFVRSTLLEVLDEEFDLSHLEFNEELWISRFDNIESNAEVAQTIWSESGFKIDSSCAEKFIPFLGNKDNGIRLSIGKAMATSVTDLNDEELFMRILNFLLEYYKEMALPPTPKKDEFGLIIKSDEKADRWEQRSGVALALKFLAPMFNSTAVEQVFNFLVKDRALGDNEAIVRTELQDTGMAIINERGNENVEILINIFESTLSEADEKSKIQDRVKESTIILYGNLARHLDASDNRIENTVSRLLEALDTPSEDVQYAVSECIAPLVPFTTDHLSKYFDDLFEKLFNGNSLAERRGAAYGIAGLVKGYGIRALSEFDVIRNLNEASDDKKDPRKREGVSFCFECLSQSLGAFFEPYVLELLPIVLKSLGDSSAEVRDATTWAAKIMMKNTTSYGIKKMIPMAIANLEDYQWRSKKGSVELLGSMAYLDPAQLSSSLPEIVPNIVQILKDTHKEVRKAADSSLKKFGEVIRNPEIQALVDDLLNAIGDPTKYTDIALEKLIKTQFSHYIDGPSLALIIHVIDRGMQDRSSLVKKKASQIIGNMAILVDSNDIMPYLSKLVEELQTAIVDPVDETRAISSRALGSLVEKLGEHRFPGLIDNLVASLQDEERPGDRLGSAQALSEVIFGLGLTKLEEMLPQLLQGANSSKSFTREGFMPMMLYLPVCFGSQFAPYLTQTIPPILNGLADTNEDVRQIALKSGRLIVSNYAKKAVDLLLPELEKGLFDTNARIRQSSADLTGELLYKISGISGKLELAEDLARASNVHKALIDVLGEDRRNHVLAALFVCRSDTHGAVRNSASDVWKALVANTPKTIKEILPTLTQIIVRRLASSDDNQRAIAAATLGDMVRRVGGNALSQLLPTLEESLVSSDSDAKQGICIAIKELIQSTNQDNVIEYQDTFVKIIKEALVDANPSVREAAAHAFDVLQGSIGSSAVDEVVPQLLEMLNRDGDNGGSEEALSALQEIMATKSDVIFPILIPSLLANPINAKAIGALAEVAGSALYKRLSIIITALVDGVIQKSGDVDEIKRALVKTIVSVDSDEGCHPLMQQILGLMKNDDAMKRKVIYEVLVDFFKETKLDYSIYTEDVVIQAIYNLDNKDRDIAKYSMEMLVVLIKSQRKEVLEKLVKPAQQTLSYIGSEDEDIYAFTLPKGPNCILPIFSHGLMYGNGDQREVAANGISNIIDKTPAAGLRPFVTGIVGPLIRVIGERYSGDVKSAILLALNKLFEKIPQMLRPFIPQLQRTFIKSLSDPSSEILRSRAAKALGTLIEYQPKVDPLVTELLNNAKTVEAENVGVKTAILKALLEVIDKAGEKMSESCKNGVMALVEKEMFQEDVQNSTIVAYARLVGSLSKILTSEELENMMKAKVLRGDLENEEYVKFGVLMLNSFLKYSGAKVLSLGLTEEIVQYLSHTTNDKSPYVSNNATLAMGKLLLILPSYEETNIELLVNQLGHIMVSPASNSPDTRRLSLTIARAISNEVYSPLMLSLIPPIFACVRDMILPIKLAAEKALLSLLDLINGMDRFDEWFSKQTETVINVEGKDIQMRSITDYIKRVGVRLANQEKERLEAGGDKEAMYSDLYEEKREIMSVGI